MAQPAIVGRRSILTVNLYKQIMEVTVCLRKKKNKFLQNRERIEAEAQEALARAEVAQREGHSLESETRFSDAFLPWLQLYKAPPTTKPTTFGSYVDIYNTHLLPWFGEIPLHVITTEDTNRPEVITQQRRVLSTEEMHIFIQEVMKES